MIILNNFSISLDGKMISIYHNFPSSEDNNIEIYFNKWMKSGPEIKSSKAFCNFIKNNTEHRAALTENEYKALNKQK